MRDFFRNHRLIFILLLASLMALAFQGGRGLMEPDEGRYSNVALQILKHDDWISLYRSPDTLHFTKPPLTYWLMAASVSVFGHNEWALRLPSALAFVFTVFLAFQLGRLFVPKRPWLPALLYLASPAAFFASNWINTDTVLAATTVLGMTCYAHYRFGGGNPRWLDGMWLAFGLAFLTKGPPGLLPLLAVIVFAIWHKHGLALLRPVGLLAFALVGFGWYALVIQRHPGLLDYFLGYELADRIVSNRFQRHGQWYGPITQFLPILLLGTLPALAAWLSARKRAQTEAFSREQTRFLWLWFALPLLVFILSRSRLPLYVLGLLLPAIVLLSRRIQVAALGKGYIFALAGWLLLLFAIKGALPFLLDDHSKDSRAFAADIRPMLPGKPDQIIFVKDMSRNGLNLYFDADIKKISFAEHPKPMSDSTYDHGLGTELRKTGSRRVFIMKRDAEAEFLKGVGDAGRDAVRLGEWAEAGKPASRTRVIYTLDGEFPRTGPERIP